METARIGARMIGSAFIPKRCHANASKWNTPKWRTNAQPANPTHPGRSGRFFGTSLARPQINPAPTSVLSTAKYHSALSRVRPGRAGEWTPGLRNVSASIPGQASRYAGACPVCARPRSGAVHHVTDLQPRKIANASAHMKPHAGKAPLKARATHGRTIRGTQPARAGRGATAGVRSRGHTPAAQLLRWAIQR